MKLSGVPTGVDNVALATHYAWPHGVGPTLAVARHARRLGMAVFFVTGRFNGDLRKIVGPLRRAGFVWDGLCGRPHGVRIAVAKESCRRAVTERGYVVTANIASHAQAFTGRYYERAVLLPDYRGRLS